jgi:hypothetical protein
LEKQTLEAEHESSLVQNSAKSTQTQTSKSTTNEATPTQAVSRAVSKHGNRSGRARKPVQSKLKDRRAMVKAYIEEVRTKTGKRITKKDIWSKAGYKSRAEFERWERQDPKRPNKAANDTFTRILREKPHLK